MPRPPLAALLAALLSLCAGAPPAPAQSPPLPDGYAAALAEKLPPLLTKLVVAERELPGAVVLVGRSTGVVYSTAVGSARLDPEVPLTVETPFRIASMSKPVAALGIGMLIEDGKIGSVSDPVEKYLPEFKGQMMVAVRDKSTLVLVPPSRPITLKDLLTHTSGLPDYPVGLAKGYSARSLSLAETTMALSQRPLEREPGTKWAYCNSGIDTAGRVVEAVSGKSYEAFLQERLFGPLKMTSTSASPSPELAAKVATVVERKPDGAFVKGGIGFLEAVPNARHPAPMGGLTSNAPDLGRLYQCLLRGGELDGVRVIKAETLSQLTRTQTGDLECGFTKGMSFGLGFAVVKEPQGITGKLSKGSFGHGGAFGTQSWADPAKDLFMIMLIARSNTTGDASPFRAAVQEVVFGVGK